MARIPDDEIERLKTEVSLVRLVESSGVELKRVGKDWHGRCPWHDDHTPSLVITPDKNLWHCLGACNTGGTVIDWTMRMRGVSFRHAVELLREAPISALAAQENPEPLPRSRAAARLPSDLSVEADDQRLMQRVVAYYHGTLKQSPEALDYLKRRGLVNGELIDAFKLGYANRTLGYRLPEKTRAAGAAIRTRLQGLGLLRESGHEHFNGCLVIPIFDREGQVVQLYGRKVGERLHGDIVRHLYLPRPHAGVFNPQALIASKEIILCEALIDALTFWCAGYRHVTSAYGVNGITDELLEAFKQHGTQRVLIAFDRDEAGDQAAAELAPKLMALGIECFRIVFPHGLDANAYALKVQPAAQSLGVAIRGAHWMGKGPVPAHVAGWRAMPNRARPRQSPEPTSIPAEPAPHADPHAGPQADPDASLAAAVAPDSVHADAVMYADVPASPMPPALTADVPIEVRPHEILILLGDRRWRVRGLTPEPVPMQMKINLLVSRGDAFHVETLDLYQQRLRGTFVRQAAAELAYPEEILKRELGAVLGKLEAIQAENLARVPVAPALTMSAEDKAAALDLLRDPQLMQRIVADLTACGIVGEDTNKLVSYLACVSRKQDRPLAVLIQSSSAAGKSALMDAVLELVPEEDRVQYSAMTGQSLYYLGTQDLKHRILAIAEEQGMADAAYPLKLLLSQGVLTIASTGKDPVTGKLVAHPYRVEGPVMLFVTTTSSTLDPELENRCLVLTVNESREQTQAIHRMQRSRRTLEGLLARTQRGRLTLLHQNAQRLLRALPVINPYVERLAFVDAAPRNRRDHEKYLGLIDAVTLLHQYQREVKTGVIDGEPIEYLETTPADIALANRLARVVLGQSLDELPPQTRRLLHLIEDLVNARMQQSMLKRADVRFSRRDVREATGWGNTQLKLHLHRLEDMEYLLIHRGHRGGFVYELAYDGQGKDGSPFLPGLIDLDAQGRAQTPHSDEPDYDRERSGANAGQSGSGRAGVGVLSGGGPTAANVEGNGVSGPSTAKAPERTSRATLNGTGHGRSRNEVFPLAAAGR